MMDSKRRVYSLPPGPRGLPCLGSAIPFSRDPLGFYQKLWRKYGDLSSFTVGKKRIVLAVHPSTAKHVLLDRRDIYSRKSFFYNTLKLIFGNGVFTSEGALWQKQRRLIQPAFHPQKIETLVSTITDCLDRMLGRWERQRLQGKPIPIIRGMSALTVEIIARAMFSKDVAADSSRISDATNILNDYTIYRMTMPIPLAFWKTLVFNKAKHYLDATIDRFIDARAASGDKGSDLLSMLLDARDAETGAPLDRQQIRDEAMTMLLAGHETTAVALSWTWYLLSTHPQVEKELHHELDAVLGGRLPTLADLTRLPLTKMIFDESMRLYSPIYGFSKEAQEDDIIGDYAIPKGTTVVLSPYLSHRHPDFWDEPETFNPWRFEADPTGRQKAAYFPFSLGQRMCVGNHLALMEAQLTLACVASRYKLELTSSETIKPLALLTLRPGREIACRLIPRFPRTIGQTTP